MASLPHFFKILLAHSLRGRKLSIPRSFIRKYGENFSNRISLKLPNDAEWKVGLLKSNGMVWLQDGWPEFVEDLSLDEGHLLVFRYDMKSCFHVLIFDKSASEIEYPSKDAEIDKKPNIVGEFHDDESVEILDDLPRFPKTREKSPPSCFQPHKKTKIRDSYSPKLEPDGEDFASSSKDVSRSMSSAPKCSKYNLAKGKKTLLGKRKVETLERARAFTSKNPFFTVIVQPSYLRGSGMMIPTSFPRIYFGQTNGDIKFRVSDGRSWVTKYVVYDGQVNTRIAFSWFEFAQDNCLKVGDVCVFELIKKVEITFLVYIFRDTEDQDPPLPSQGLVEKRGASGVKPDNVMESTVERKLHTDVEVGTSCSSSDHSTATEEQPSSSSARQSASEFTSENPFFMVTMKPSYVNSKSYLNIPDEFSKSYLNDSNIHQLDSIILRTPEGRTWSARLYLRHRNSILSVRIICGWKAFVRDNSMKTGDICAFELIRGVKISFNVTTFRVSEGTKCGQPPPANESFTEKNQPTGNSRNEDEIDFSSKASDTSGKVLSGNSFEVLLQPSNIKDSKVTIPYDFARKYFVKGLEKVRLQVGERLWTVILSADALQVRLSGGFRAFAKENFLESGDVCNFQLINKKDFVFKVNIFKDL